MSKVNYEEDIVAIMEEMEAMTPKSTDKTTVFDELDAKSTPEEVIKKPADVTDAKGSWGSMFVPKPPKPGKLHPSRPTNERYYDFTHPRLGYAIIFNQMKIKGESERKGSRKDANDFSTTLASLGFDVKIHNDFTVDKIHRELYASEKRAIKKMFSLKFRFLF